MGAPPPQPSAACSQILDARILRGMRSNLTWVVLMDKWLIVVIGWGIVVSVLAIAASYVRAGARADSLGDPGVSRGSSEAPCSSHRGWLLQRRPRRLRSQRPASQRALNTLSQG